MLGVLGVKSMSCLLNNNVRLFRIGYVKKLRLFSMYVFFSGDRIRVETKEGIPEPNI